MFFLKYPLQISSRPLKNLEFGTNSKLHFEHFIVPLKIKFTFIFSPNLPKRKA